MSSMQMVGELKARTTGCLLAYSVRTGTRTHAIDIPVYRCSIIDIVIALEIAVLNPFS